MDFTHTVLRKDDSKHARYPSFAPGHKQFLELDGDEPPPPKKIPLEFRLELQKARNDRGMTRDQLAKKINVQESVIRDYEIGKAVPNGSIILKLNKALGTSLSCK